MVIKIGSKVRSYDFAMVGKYDSYIEGVVVGFEELEGCTRYKIRADKRVIENKEVELESEFFFPPVNGTPSLFGGPTDFVELLKGEQNES